MQALVTLRRANKQLASEGRERTHLLYLFEPLTKCVVLGEPRIRDTLQGLLQLAGAELGLCAEVHQPL